jgi:hypothetical protein
MTQPRLCAAPWASFSGKEDQQEAASWCIYQDGLSVEFKGMWTRRLLMSSPMFCFTHSTLAPHDTNTGAGG